MIHVSAKSKNKIRTHSILAYIMLAVLILYVVSLIVPFLWGLLTSLKDRNDFADNLFGLPQVWRFSNYGTAFKYFYVDVYKSDGSTSTVYFYQMFLNSFLYNLGVALIGNFVNMCASYLCGVYDNKASRSIVNVIIITIIMPIVGALPSTLVVYRALGFYDNMIGMWVVAAGFGGMNFLIYRGIFRGVSRAYMEAAAIDGANRLRIMFTIMLPFGLNMYFIFVLLSFIGGWNDYTSALLYLPSYPTAAYGLYLFSQSTSNATSSVPMRMAGCFLMCIPVLVIFFIFKDKLIGNVAVGGLKG